MMIRSVRLLCRLIEDHQFVFVASEPGDRGT